jgi:hypothetical protein
MLQVCVTLVNTRTGEEMRTPAADRTVHPGENDFTIVVEKPKR